MRRLFVFFSMIIVVSSCDDIIEVTDISNENVVTLAPTGNTVVTSNKVTFIWEGVVEADNYRIQIASPNFENASQILADSSFAGTSFLKDLENGDYEWRVRAENSAYTTAFNANLFKVASTETATDISNINVVLTTPTDNATFSTTDTINLSWELVTGATEYDLQIVTPSFESITTSISDETLSEPTFSINNLEVGTYQWRVRAKNPKYNTNYTTQTFTIQ